MQAEIMMMTFTLHINVKKRRNKLKLVNFIFSVLFSKGHMQQGGSPTPFDRNMGTKMAAKCLHWLVDSIHKGPAQGADTACLLGVVKRQYQFTPLEELKAQTNFA